MIKVFYKTAPPLHIAGCISALAYLALCLSSQTEGSATLVDLWVVSLICGLLCFALWHYQGKAESPPLSISGVLLWALVFRLIGVASFPVMEDDFYRFLWDGRMMVETGNPYIQAPAEFFGHETELTDAEEYILSGINHPDIKTVYGPLNQYLFALSHLIAPGKVWPLQLLMALLDMGLVWLLLKLAPIRSVLLYAWCPLAIKEFAFTAHPDIIALLPLVAALCSVRKQQLQRAAIWLALAVCAKVFALILVPLLLRWQWRSWLTFSATIALLWVPISGAQLPEGLSAMAEGWQFNAPLYQFLGGVLSFNTLKFSLLALFIIAWGIYAFKFIKQPLNCLPRGDWLFGLLLLCSPVFNPWYALWILPFAVIWPSRWAWTASLAVLFAYASGINMPASDLGLYQQPGWLVALEFTLIGAAVFWDWKSRTNTYCKKNGQI